MSSNEQDVWQAISSVLDKNPSTEEKQLFDKWMNENSANRKQFEILTRVGYTGDIEHMKSVKDEIYAKIMNKANVASHTKKVRLIRYFAAASVIVLLCLGTWLYINSSANKRKALVETLVPFGKQSKIVLSDGTVVNLNSGSSLKYPATFGGKKIRSVQLQGEAYFEVAKDKNHPFIVNAGVLDIKVLGTHFNVKAYSDEGRITTTLLEGAISISKANAEASDKDIMVSPDQQVTFTKNSGSFQVQKVDATLYSGWKDGQYYFYRDNLSFIAKQLERNYNIKISISSDFLKSQIFSGSARKDDNIFQILDVMKKYRSFDYTAYKDSIVLFEKTK